MTQLTPEDMAKHVKRMAENIKAAKRGSVAVGLPSEKIGGKVYGNGMSVIQVGAIHEYGAGNNPRRSFLRVPFDTKKDEITAAIAAQFRSVFEDGVDAKKALGLVGAEATNISKGAFRARGYGTWPDIKQSTKTAKGSSQPLIDTGTLRNSITWIVRGV